MKLFSEDTLSHYGIQGQKKGIRRWQYPDGRFNEEGKIRYFGYPKRNKKKYLNKDGVLAEYIVPLVIYSTFALGEYLLEKNKIIDIKKLQNKDLSKKERMSNNIENKEIENQILERTKNEKFNEEFGLYEKNDKENYLEDIKKVNPHFSQEKKYNLGPRMNCVYCSHTYFMRRAGFDVTAKYNSKGVVLLPGQNITKEVFGEKNIKDSFWNSYVPKNISWTHNEMMKLSSKKAQQEGFEKFEKMSSNLKKNQGITFTVYFKGFGGHALAAEKINGKLKIIDAQSNRVYDGIEDYKNTHPEFTIKQGEVIDYSNIKAEDINKNIIKNMMY